MENKKPLIIVAIVLLVALTGWVLIVKLKDLKTAKNANPLAVNEAKKTDQETVNQEATNKEAYENIDTSKLPSDGTVLGIQNNTVTLLTNAGEKTVEITPDYTIYLINGNKQDAVKIADLKKGSEVRIRYDGQEKPPKINTSDANQGSVTAIGAQSITVKMDSGEKVIDTTANPTIYLVEGGQSVLKKVSDLKIGTIVTVAYADAVTKALAVAIRIDKL